MHGVSFTIKIAQKQSVRAEDAEDLYPRPITSC